MKDKIHKVARNTSRRIPHEKNIKKKSKPTSTISFIIDIISQFGAYDPCFTTITFPRNRASFRFILRGILWSFFWSYNIHNHPYQLSIFSSLLIFTLVYSIVLLIYIPLSLSSLQPAALMAFKSPPQAQILTLFWEHLRNK